MDIEAARGRKGIRSGGAVNGRCRVLRAALDAACGTGFPPRRHRDPAALAAFALKGSSMDLRFTPEENAFRDEVRAFMRTALPEPIRRKMADGRRIGKEDLVTWQRILNAKGWAVPHWPVAWGGTDWSQVQRYIFGEELQQAPAPDPLPFGCMMVGPVIIAFGSEAQKRRHLARIANLDDWWCQGFSEPGAGSDLASLKTAARRDGEHYVVNGQKTWTTMAQHADWIFCLVRTDAAAKKQQGISFLLIDMKMPGITVRPIQIIDGGYDVNEVFFDDVRVPVENRIGDENRGWDYAKFLLGNERTGIARIGASKARIRRLKEIAALKRVGDRPLMEDERFRMKIAAIEVELKALEMTQLRVVAAERGRADKRPDPASSILKIKGTEIQQAISELLLEAVGPFGLPAEQDEIDGRNEPPIGPDWAGPVAPYYFNLRKVSIYGGSNEIQKNIIAKAILGL
jgi:pimeloyl-CoA dehydrogenase large subunit